MTLTDSERALLRWEARIARVEEGQTPGKRLEEQVQAAVEAFRAQTTSDKERRAVELLEQLLGLGMSLDEIKAGLEVVRASR